jgi:hypothetical protein
MKKQFLINTVLSACFLISSFGAPDSNPNRESMAAPAAGIAPSRGRIECNYTMNVGVRPLLFWIGWSDIGGGQIGWIKDPDGEESLELLIGSDPARTPRQINRWGYISEHIAGSSADLIGIMTQTDEQSIEQAKAVVGKTEKKHAFKAIRSRLSGSEAQSSTIQLHFDKNFTYRDASSVLNLIPASGSSFRQLRIPDGTDPGFLFAVKEIIRESVDQYRGSGDWSHPKPRRYVYSATLFNLSVVSARLLDKMEVNGHQYTELIENRFEAYNTVTHKTSKFIVTYGTAAPISEIPIRIVYQPRWWFRAELLLDTGAGTDLTAGGSGKQ